jgi:hypothetical protein
MACSMQRGTKITDISPEVFMLIVDHLLLPVTADDGDYIDTLDFACLRLSSRGVRQLCDAVVRRLGLHLCSSNETEHLLRRFSSATTVLSPVYLAQPLACLQDVDVIWAAMACTRKPTLVHRIVVKSFTIYCCVRITRICSTRFKSQAATWQGLGLPVVFTLTAFMSPTIRCRCANAGAAADLQIGAGSPAAAHRPAQPAPTVPAFLLFHDLPIVLHDVDYCIIPDRQPSWSPSETPAVLGRWATSSVQKWEREV